MSVQFLYERVLTENIAGERLLLLFCIRRDLDWFLVPNASRSEIFRGFPSSIHDIMQHQFKYATVSSFEILLLHHS